MLDFFTSGSFFALCIEAAIVCALCAVCAVVFQKIKDREDAKALEHEREKAKVEAERAKAMSQIEAAYNKEMSNALVCQKCGAPLKGNVCEYCGASYLYKTTYMSDFTKKQ